MRRFVGRDRRLYFNKALCELQMGLFDHAIATCKAYLKPVKQATRELILLQEKAKFTKEADEINEEAKLNELLGDTYAAKDPELLRTHKKNLQ